MSEDPRSELPIQQNPDHDGKEFEIKVLSEELIDEQLEQARIAFGSFGDQALIEAYYTSEQRSIAREAFNLLLHHEPDEKEIFTHKDGRPEYRIDRRLEEGEQHMVRIRELIAPDHIYCGYMCSVYLDPFADTEPESPIFDEHIHLVAHAVIIDRDYANQEIGGFAETMYDTNPYEERRKIKRNNMVNGLLRDAGLVLTVEPSWMNESQSTLKCVIKTAGKTWTQTWRKLRKTVNVNGRDHVAFFRIPSEVEPDDGVNDGPSKQDRRNIVRPSPKLEGI
jgi:hypothetical protein